MRPIEQDGKWGQKSRTVDGIKIPTVDWNEHDRAEDWRKAWAAYCNTALRIHGHKTLVDHRSYERQGIEQVPTIHMGAAASQMERRGIRTERGNINREIEITNKELRQLKARIAKLQTWLKEEMESTETPTLADVFENILKRRQGYYSSTSGLKAAANILNFLTANKIMDMAGLDDKFKSMIDRQLAMNDKLKKVNRRLKTLDEHIEQGEKCKAYRGYKSQYDKLYAEYETLNKSTGLFAKGKAQKALAAANAYYETHRAEITLYEAAERYMKDVLQGHFDPKKLPPVTKWKTEREKLTAEKQQLNREFAALKADTDAASKIRSSVHDIMSEERRERQPRRAQGMEL
jgi:hypothetical protein